MNEEKPAWSRESVMLRLPTSPDIGRYSPEWVFGTSTGTGVRVAIIDSGVDGDHPSLGGSIDEAGGVEFTIDAAGEVARRDGSHGDVYGHGTACAGIVHSLAPDATITSVRVLDAGLRGRAAAFHAGLAWAVDEGFDIINLSLGAAKREWALAFHDTCDRGYFNNSFIVTAANNIRRDSFPSLFASVTSVAANNSSDPLRFHFNPEPPTEFLARGIDVEVPWLDGTTITTTGNSFAAPHIAGFAALIKAEHPELRPFQIKTALLAASANVREATADRAERSMADSELDGARAATPTTAGRPSVNIGAARSDAQPGDAERVEIQELLRGAYEVGPLLARGPWGPVYSATSDGRALALRRLDPTLGADEATRTRFAVSVRIAAELRHPHILPILDLVESDHFAVMVMPRCPTNLAEQQATGPTEPAAAVTAVISLLRALHVAHAAGIYHGDLRPDNALIDEHKRVLLSDVGIASALSSQVALRTAPHDPASWNHLAPEQVAGGAIGAFTDLHATGLLLFELMTGSLPYPRADSPAQAIERRAALAPRSLATMTAAIPPAIAELADRAVRPDPAERPASAAGLADDLTKAATEAFGSGWLRRQRYHLDIA